MIRAAAAPPSSIRRAAAEAVGTAILLAGIVGSGIMAERLSGGNTGLALLANALATGGVLVAIILAFAPISGAHFNPLVTLSSAMHGEIAWPEAAAFVLAQFVGALAGVALANLMFGYSALFFSHRARHEPGMLLAEFVATFGLLAVIRGCARARPFATGVAVGAYIVGAYWFTSSTSFANPAVTFARAFSDTFAGIAPFDVPGFVLFETLGALGATLFFLWLVPRKAAAMKRSVLFVCEHNSARSQMAQAFLRERCPRDFEAESAGLEPGTLNPLAVAAMQEIGIDISEQTPKAAFDLFKAGRHFSYVITVCDEATAERCPVFPGGARRLHWSFRDPSSLTGAWEERLASTRTIRDQIRTAIDAFCASACA